MPLNDYFGAAETDTANNALRLTVTRYQEGMRIPAHEHGKAYICINTKGVFSERSGNTEHAVHVHDLVYHPPGHRHSNRFFSTGGKCLNLELESNWFEKMPRALRENKPVYACDPEIRRLSRALIRESQRPDNELPAAVDDLLLELLKRFNGPLRRRGAQPPPWLLTVRDRLHSTYTECHRLTELAETADVHPVHLAREFKRQFGCSTQAYVRQCRIRAAISMLAAGEEPLSEIALQLGFYSQSHFSRVFKGGTGVSPGAYRRAMRNNGKR